MFYILPDVRTARLRVDHYHQHVSPCLVEDEKQLLHNKSEKEEILKLYNRRDIRLRHTTYDYDIQHTTCTHRRDINTLQAPACNIFLNDK